MKKRKLKAEVEVWGIEIEETSKYEDGTGCGWWKFEYSIRINGGKKKLGQKDGSWSNQTKKRFTRTMGGDYPARQVLSDDFY